MPDRGQPDDKDRYDHSDHPVNRAHPEDLKAPGSAGKESPHSRHPGANPNAIDERQSPKPP